MGESGPMGMLDFLKPSVGVTGSDARKTVYRHRIAQLETGIRSPGGTGKSKEGAVFDFLSEFFEKFFGVGRKGGSVMEALKKIESSPADVRVKNRADALYKRFVQYEKMGLPVGDVELLNLLSSCRELLELI